jgi:hypothetical protein
MRFLTIFSRQKFYFWLVAFFISLILALLFAGLSIILLSQIFFQGRVPVELLVLTISMVPVVSGLIIFVFYKTFYPFLSLSVEVESDGVLIKNTTSEELRVALQTAELRRKYKTRGGSSYIYTVQPLQILKTENIEPGKEVFEKIDPEKSFLEYKDLAFLERIKFSGIQVSTKNGKNFWIAFCQPYAVVFSSPREQDKQGLILRPVWKKLRKIAKDLHKEETATKTDIEEMIETI